MKRFSAQSTEKAVRLHLALLIALTLAGASCVSEPAPVQPATTTPVTAEPVTTGPAQPQALEADEKPEVAAMMRQAPKSALPVTRLAEPALPAAKTVQKPEGIPTDITVLSVAPAVAFAPVVLPEPAALPAKPAPVTVPAAAAKPATTTPAPAATKPAATKPAATTSTPKPAAAVVPAPAAASADTSASAATTPKVELPAAPTSSARSVAAAASLPTAETRISTVRGERFELRFPGTGWVYLGDEGGQEGLKYETRRFEEYLLRFQRQNPVDQSTEISLVRVVVSEKAASTTQAPATPAPASTAATGATTAGTSGTATDAATTVASTAGTSGTATDAATTATSTAAATPVGTTAGTTAGTSTGTSSVDSSSTGAATAGASTTGTAAPGVSAASLTDPAALIKLARDELGAKRVQTAIEALDRYLSLYPYGTDELFYLYALAYEQDTPFRNIKKAYENYKRVRDEYPRSARWQAADERVSYLERHYFGLR